MPVMEAPTSGVKIRMYRIGHGDCFLLALRDDEQLPFYILIDCGYKLGSNVGEVKIEDIVADIRESTGGRIDVVVITHEHEDHVNGFWNKFGTTEKAYFDDIEVGELWLAWTEDPLDGDANDLRDRYNDMLLGLMAVSDLLGAAPDEASQAVHSRIEALLGFEIEGERDEFRALAIKGIKNKRAIQYVRTKVEEGARYLEPHMTPFPVSDKVTGPLIYVLGPPRKEELLLSMDPEGSEGYSQGFALDRGASAFFAAARLEAGGDPDELSEPFPPRHRIPVEEAFSGPHAAFFDTMYGSDPEEHPEAWRRIDHDWLQAAEMLALRLNSEVNNTCLVLAIELPASKRVLLFPGDAQRGSWISWDDGEWITPAGEQVKAKDLLGRVVFYKVGHHGSHNATLKGQWYSDHPNLNWMARGAYRPDFVAMIPANRPWAYEKADWRHPLPSIERALARKTRGRLFRTDRDHVPQSDEVTGAGWAAFQAQTVETALYLEYTVLDEGG